MRSITQHRVVNPEWYKCESRLYKPGMRVSFQCHQKWYKGEVLYRYYTVNHYQGSMRALPADYHNRRTAILCNDGRVRTTEHSLKILR